MRDLTPPIKRKPYVKPEIKPEPPPEGTQFRCFGCQKELFGVFDKEGTLVIRYGDRVTQITGVVNCTCRKCGTTSMIDTRYVSYKVSITFGTQVAEPLATDAAWEYAKEHGIDLKEIPVNGKITVREVKRYNEGNPGS